MTKATNLSDKALSVFAFAAYHQLESGQKVTKVIRRDGSGHQADPEAVQELESRGLVTATDDEISFEPEAERILEQIVESMRRAASGG
jgi:chromosome segregation and condensation protein ScpB